MTNATANFAAIVTATIIGTDRKYLMPNLDGSKAEGEMKDAWGEAMETVINNEAHAAVLLADPFELPEIGGDLENALVSLTERVMDKAIAQGFAPSNKGANPTEVWNTAVEELALFINAETTTPPVELEVTPLTAEQSAEIVSEVETTPEGAAALEDAQQIVSEELGIQVSAEAALQILSGEKILKAQNTSIALSGAAKNKLATVLGELQEVLEMVGASEHIQVALRDAAQAAIPATVEIVEVTA